MTPDFNFLKVAMVLGGFALFYFFSIRETPIYDETEGQYAGAVRTMSGYFEVPTNNEIPRVQKPPLTYWLMKLSASLIKDHEYAMRVPFILALLGLLLMTYAIGVEVMDADRGLAAMMLLGSCFGLFIFGRMVMPEIVLSFFIALTFWASIKALLASSYSSRLNWWTVVWGGMALGSLAKGFHGALWPLMVFAIARGLELFQRGAWCGFWRIRNLVLFFAITLPWYLVVELKYPGFIRDNLWNEQIGHSFDFRFPPTYSRVSLFDFLLQHLFLLFPMILLIPHALKRFELTRDHYAQRQMRKMILILPVVVLATTLFSARQDYYTMTSWFAVSIFAVVGLDQRSRTRWIAFPFWILGLMGFSLLLFGMIWQGSESRGLRSDTTDHLFSILSQLPVAIRPLFFLAGLTLIVGAVIGFLMCRPQFYSSIVIAFVISMSGPLWGASVGVKILAESFSLKKTAQFIPKISHSMLVVDGPVPLASSLFYYLKEKIYFVGANPQAEFVTRNQGIGHEQYLVLEDFIGLWKSEQNLLLIIHEKDRDFWKSALGEDFFEITEAKSGARMLIKNHPVELE